MAFRKYRLFSSRKETCEKERWYAMFNLLILQGGNGGFTR